MISPLSEFDSARTFKEISIGGIAATFGVLCCLPTINFKNELQRGSGRDLVGLFQHPVRFFNGVAPLALCTFVGSAIAFTVDAEFKRTWQKEKSKLSLGEEIFAGAVGGLLSGPLTSWCEFMMIQEGLEKQRVLAAKVNIEPYEIKSRFELMRGITHQYGIKAFNRGILNLSFRESGFQACYLGLASSHPLLATVLALVITHPSDTFSTRAKTDITAKITFKNFLSRKPFQGICARGLTIGIYMYTATPVKDKLSEVFLS